MNWKRTKYPFARSNRFSAVNIMNPADKQLILNGLPVLSDSCQEVR